MFTIDLAHQRRMEEAFFRQLPERCRPGGEQERPLPMTVGIETEYLIVDEQGQLLPESVRNRMLELLPHSSPELGVSTIETHTDPVPIVDTSHGMIQEMQRVEQEAIQVASSLGCSLVRVGAYPGPFQDLAITQQPDRYQHLMDLCHHFHALDEDDIPIIQIGTLTLPRKRCEVLSGCQSIHLNLQIPAGQVAIEMLNKTIELVPYLVALGAHAPLMDCRPSGYSEVRAALWEPLFTFPSVDVRYGVNSRRTGLPDYYYRSWDDYWRDVGRKLYLTGDVNHAFDSNIKQFWRTVRLKPCPGCETDCLLEMRALSTQPTLEEDAAFYLLLCGLLLHREWRSRPLLPLEYVKVNLDQASRYGLHATLYTRDQTGEITRQPATAMAAQLLESALDVWSERSAEAVELVALLRRRLDLHGETPALASLRMYKHEIQAGRTIEEAARRVFLSHIVSSQFARSV